MPWRSARNSASRKWYPATSLFRGSLVAGELAQKSMGVGLVARLVAVARQGEGLPGSGRRFGGATRKPVNFAQRYQRAGVVGHDALGTVLLERALDHGEPLVDPSARA